MEKGEITAEEGSSPLARGLHRDLHLISHSTRIIPARAGFTGRPREDRWLTPDHPRSRGVYSQAAVSATTTPGSSPLARGLLESPRPLAAELRIIPARAGFTPAASALICSYQDHPRSRGVYGLSRPRERAIEGSSPLARGLPAD